MYVTTLYPIIIFQKSFLRIITRKPRTKHSWPIFVRLNIMSLRNLHVYKVLKLFFIRSSGINLTRDIIYDFWRSGISALLAQVPQSNVTVFQDSFYFNAQRLFNLILSKLEHLQPLSLFLKSLKVYRFTISDCQSFIRIMR
jgi:hypothetical protein